MNGFDHDGLNSFNDSLVLSTGLAAIRVVVVVVIFAVVSWLVDARSVARSVPAISSNLSFPNYYTISYQCGLSQLHIYMSRMVWKQ